MPMLPPLPEDRVSAEIRLGMPVASVPLTLMKLELIEILPLGAVLAVEVLMRPPWRMESRLALMVIFPPAPVAPALDSDSKPLLVPLISMTPALTRISPPAPAPTVLAKTNAPFLTVKRGVLMEIVPALVSKPLF